jgi:hypothetical protein
MSKALLYVVVGAAIVALVLGLWWLFWALWTWVLPQIWPNGPDAIVRPSYWLFVGCLLLASLIGRLLFKSDNP